MVIGVWGVNYYAREGATLFSTKDRDLFLPSDAMNLRRAWQACADAGFTLWCGNEPLDSVRDDRLARAIIEHRALTTAQDETGVQVDLTLVMAGFDFESVWSRRRTFVVDGVPMPVASLTDIVTSKSIAGRPKDRLFLATHAEALGAMLERDRGR